MLQLYKGIHVLQGKLQPVNKKIGAMTFQPKFALYLPYLKSFDTFPTSAKMRRLSVLQRAREIETSNSLMSLHGRILA